MTHADLVLLNLEQEPQQPSGCWGWPVAVIALILIAVGLAWALVNTKAECRRLEGLVAHHEQQAIPAVVAESPKSQLKELEEVPGSTIYLEYLSSDGTIEKRWGRSK